jgi:secondary thiamine-phosphate synthase enzyme
MVVTKKISLQSKGHCDIIDITPEVQQQLAETDISNGTVTLFVTGSTAGISTIEFESGLLSDFQGMWERNVPRDIPYKHDRAWGEGNGYSHVRASLLGASLVIPFSDKKLALGTWQQIVLVDFDNRPRSRQITVQIMGE